MRFICFRLLVYRENFLESFTQFKRVLVDAERVKKRFVFNESLAVVKEILVCSRSIGKYCVSDVFSDCRVVRARDSLNKLKLFVKHLNKSVDNRLFINSVFNCILVCVSLSGKFVYFYHEQLNSSYYFLVSFNI